MKANVIKNPFRGSLNTAQVITSATVAVTGGQFMEIGRYTVPAGAALALGYESMTGQDSAAGRIFADFRDNAASPGGKVEGTLRIEVQNSQKRVQLTAWEMRTERLRTDVADPNKWIPFPFINAVATEDVSFVFMFCADANKTLGQANCVIVMDTTQFEAQ